MGDRNIDMDLSAGGGNVFVSYSRRNLDFANQIVALLEDEGYDPRIDREDIEVTEKWLSRLSELISSSDTVVFVLTDEYLASKNCEWEIKEAIGKGKRLIPILPKPITTETVPADLASLNYIHFFNLNEGDGTGFYNGVKSLKRALRHDLERLRLRRRYEDRAAGWAAGEDDLLSGDQLAQAEAWVLDAQKVDGVPEEIATYIAASRDAQDRRLTRRRRLTYAFGALASLALVATAFGGLSWWQALEKQADAEEAESLALEAKTALEVAKDDSEVFASAARTWAQASGFLGANEFEQRVPSGETALDATELAVSGLDQAREAMAGIGNADSAHIREITNAIRRDLAKARFYNEANTAVDPIDEIFASAAVASPGASEDDVTEASALLRTASDYLSRAIYSCLDYGREDDREDRRPLIRDELLAAPDEVKALFSWKDVARRSESPAMCGEARDAICEIASDCPGAQAGLTDTIARPPSRSVNAPADTGGAFAITQLYIHISDEADREKAQAIADKLVAKNPAYRVLGIELVKSEPGKNRSVRYYYDRQQGQADALAEMCAELAEESGFAAWGDRSSYRTISLAGRYEGLPPNRAEIWF